MWLFPVVLVSLLLGSAMPMETFWWRCPKRPPAVADFDMERFEGLWYLVETFDPKEECLTWTISKGDAPNEWTVVEGSESGPINAVGLRHETFNTGTITQPDKANPAHLRIFWPISGIAGDAAFTVSSTDYDNFAGVFECQNVVTFHRQNGIVLSRTPILKVDLKQNARINSEGINTAYYQKVKQGNCKYRYEENANKTQKVDSQDEWFHDSH